MFRSTILLFLLPATLDASLVTPQAVQRRADQASLVADIQILQLESMPDTALYARSHATARVVQVHWQSEHTPQPVDTDSTLVFEIPGGEVGDVGVRYSAYARPYRGRSYRATFRASGQGKLELAGSVASLVDLARSRGPSRNRTDGSDGAGTGPFLYWDRTYFPIPYFISLPNFPQSPEVLEAIDRSFRTWRDPEGVFLEFLPMGCTSSDANRNDGINSILFITNQWPFDPDAIAITRNFYVSGTGPRAGLILDTDILINAVDHAFSTDGTAATHDVQNILTHEVGHLIGLGHEVPPEDEQATMYSTAQENETIKRTLAPNDLRALRSAYAGSGSKHPYYPSSAACNVERQPFSCLSVPHKKTSPEAAIWWGFAVVAIWLAGAIYKRQAI